MKALDPNNRPDAARAGHRRGRRGRERVRPGARARSRAAGPQRRRRALGDAQARACRSTRGPSRPPSAERSVAAIAGDAPDEGALRFASLRTAAPSMERGAPRRRASCSPSPRFRRSSRRSRPGRSAGPPAVRALAGALAVPAVVTAAAGADAAGGAAVPCARRARLLERRRCRSAPDGSPPARASAVPSLPPVTGRGHPGHDAGAPRSRGPPRRLGACAPRKRPAHPALAASLNPHDRPHLSFPLRARRAASSPAA